MEKLAGYVISKHSRRQYPVKWVEDDKTAWISRGTDTWEMVCYEVKSTEDANTCAQKFIDSQPELF
jgi:hypothetical protein